MAPDGDHIVTELVLQALRGEHLVPRAPLGRRVQLAYVDDVVETLARAMNREQPTRAVVAPSCESTVLDLAYLVAEAAGLAGVEVVEACGDGPPSLPMSSRPTLVDALPAWSALGLAASVDLQEGLRRTVGWFESRGIRRPGDRPSGVYERDTTPATAPVEVPASRRAG